MKAHDNALTQSLDVLDDELRERDQAGLGRFAADISHLHHAPEAAVS